MLKSKLICNKKYVHFLFLFILGMSNLLTSINEDINNTKIINKSEANEKTPEQVFGNPLTALHGANGVQYIIDLPGHYILEEDIYLDKGDFIIINSNDVSLDLQGHLLLSKENDGARTAITVLGKNNIEIKNGTIDLFVQGISAASVNNLIIKNMYFTNELSAINMLNCSNVQMKNVKVRNCSNSIIGKGITKSSFEKLLLTDNESNGLYLEKCSCCCIINTELLTNKENGLYLLNSDSCIINDIIYVGNEQSGLHIVDSYELTINNNNMLNNGYCGSLISTQTEDKTTKSYNILFHFCKAINNKKGGFCINIDRFNSTWYYPTYIHNISYYWCAALYNGTQARHILKSDSINTNNGFGFSIVVSNSEEHENMVENIHYDQCTSKFNTGNGFETTSIENNTEDQLINSISNTQYTNCFSSNNILNGFFLSHSNTEVIKSYSNFNILDGFYSYGSNVLSDIESHHNKRNGVNIVNNLEENAACITKSTVEKNEQCGIRFNAKGSISLCSILHNDIGILMDDTFSVTTIDNTLLLNTIDEKYSSLEFVEESLSDNIKSSIESKLDNIQVS